MAQPYRQYRPSVPRNTPSPKRLRRWKAIIFMLLAVIVLLIPVLWIGQKQQPGPGDNRAETTAPTFDTTQFSLVSAYRSHDTQKVIYDSEVKGFGQVQADRESARPGHSEHQTGWAADLAGPDKKCEIKLCFADTDEGKWLATNAHKYGFIIRYPGGKESITGYQYEPWHLRYVGTALAEEMHGTGIQTLEEFFDLSPASSY